MSTFSRVALTWGGLALAAVILFPVFQNVPTIAPIASCQSNYKQLGLALWQYSEDNDGCLPMTVAAKNGRTWREELYPFIKSTSVYVCPEDHSDYSRVSPDKLPHSYGANVIGGGRGMFSVPDSHSSKLVNANQAITAIDMRGYDGPDWDMTGPAFLPATGRELYAHVPRHLFYEHPGGTLNCLFADGHAKSMRPMVTLSPVNLWTRDNAPFTGQDLGNARAILTHAEDE